MLRVALFEPEIPPNPGNVARLWAATRTPLHVVGVTGFRLDDRAVRRAGLDYWPEVELHRHRDLEALRGALDGARFLYLTTKAERSYADWAFAADDCLVFGPETRPAGRTPARELGALPHRSEEHTSELQSHSDLVCRLL